MAQTPREFIDKRLGGTNAAAEATGRKPNAVRMWAHRRTIPRTVWPDLQEAYPDLTLDELRALERYG